MGQKKRQRKHKVGSGQKRVSRARQTLQRIKMKINRWRRNQTDEHKVKAGKGCRNWDTQGLEKHAKFLEKIIKKGPKKAPYVSPPSILG